jgi:Undecaprenyl-phosphate glucose phosphotransferase
MIRTKLAVQQIALKVGIYAAFTSSFWLSFWLRFESGWIPRRPGETHSTDYVILFLVAVAAWSFLTRSLELDQLWLASNPIRWIQKGAWATLGTLMVVSFGAFFIRTYSFSRLFIGLLGCLNLVTLAAVLRFLLSMAARRNGSRDEIRVLMLGDSAHAEKVSERITRNSWIPCRVVGYVAVTEDDVENSLPKLGELHELESISRRHEPDEILVAVPLVQLGRVPELRKALARLSVPSRLVCDFLQEVAGGESILDFFGTPVVDLHRHPGDSLVYGLLKRSFDLAVASVLLVALSPVILLVAILVKLTSSGPVLFSQKRVGLHGRPFDMYKFRTMYPQNEQSSDVVWTTPGDERCTPLGKLLRRLNLDELPQLWNVVQGDMSLVGPRPERPFFVDKFADEIEGYNVRHFLKSGITGWAQVNGWRGDTSIARRIEYDLYYLTNWSFGLDIKILWLTLWRGFRDRNAY